MSDTDRSSEESVKPKRVAPTFVSKHTRTQACIPAHVSLFDTSEESFQQKQKRKINTLLYRFYEPPHHDPTQLPLEMRTHFQTSQHCHEHETHTLGYIKNPLYNFVHVAHALRALRTQMQTLCVGELEDIYTHTCRRIVSDQQNTHTPTHTHTQPPPHPHAITQGSSLCRMCKIQACLTKICAMALKLSTAATSMDSIKDSYAHMIEEHAAYISASATLATELLIREKTYKREQQKLKVYDTMNLFGFNILTSTVIKEPASLTNNDTRGEGGGTSSGTQFLDEDICRLFNEVRKKASKVRRYPKLPPFRDGTIWDTYNAAMTKMILAEKQYGKNKDNISQNERTKIEEELKHEAAELHAFAKQSWRQYRSSAKLIQHHMLQQHSEFGNFPKLKNGRFQVLNVLGKGGFAEVWEAFDTSKMDMKAIKITQLDDRMDERQQEFILDATLREVKLQRELKHDNILEMEQCFNISKTQFVAVLEMCEGTDLAVYIYEKGPIGERQAIIWITQIIEGVQYIHKVGNAVHFDLKPHNILLHESRVKISDFGLHKPFMSDGVVEIGLDSEQSMCGTIWYMPPEHIQAVISSKERVQFDGKFDVWSIGIILYEMLYQRRPFGRSAHVRGVTQEQCGACILYEYNNGGVVFPKTPAVSNECKEFIRALLSDVSVRPTVDEALRHAYLDRTRPTRKDTYT